MTAHRRAARRLPSIGCWARGVTIAALVAAPWAAARADGVTPLNVLRNSRWLLGVSASGGPDYAGSDRTSISLQPLWAWQYGRFRISSPRASGLLDFRAETRGPGASVELFSSDQIKFGAGLRLDGGRTSTDSPDLAGLPDIARTVRGRVYASYAFSDRWGAGASVSQDLLGHGGGAVAVLELGYHAPLWQRSEWAVNVGASYGNATYMRSYYGISQESSQQTGLAAYEPGAGLRDLHASIGLTSLLSEHWIAFGGLAVTLLRGPAAASPLTSTTSSPSATAGIAYRWGP